MENHQKVKHQPAIKTSQHSEEADFESHWLFASSIKQTLGEMAYQSNHSSGRPAWS